MHWSIDAIFTKGVFKPDRPLPLREDERVHLEVQELSAGHPPVNGHAKTTTADGHHRLIEHLRTSPGYDLGGTYPTRDELYDE